MNINEIESIQRRISIFSEYIKTPEAACFDSGQIFSYLSEENKSLLSPISNNLNIYLNCLQQVTRWKDHIYKDAIQDKSDNNYDHTLEMLIINNEFKNLKLNSVNHNDIELMILLHDGGEIITDDISNHNTNTDPILKYIKELETRVFVPCVLGQITRREDYSVRKKLQNLYNRYNSRQNNPLDSESHITKLMDLFQGNNFGLENVYSKTKLNEFYTENNIPKNPEDIIKHMINKEIYQLEIVLDGVANLEDKRKILDYYLKSQYIKYSNSKYGYQEISIKFQPIINRIICKISPLS